MTQYINIQYEAKRLRLLAAALELQHHTTNAANLVKIPGGDCVVAIGTPADVAKLLTAPAARQVGGRRKLPLFCAHCGTAKVIGQDRCLCGSNAFSRVARARVEHDHSEGGHHD